MTAEKVGRWGYGDDSHRLQTNARCTFVRVVQMRGGGPQRGGTNEAGHDDAAMATKSKCPPRRVTCIAVFPILADVVEVKTGSQSTAHWSNDFIRMNGWLRNCFAQLIIPLDIDGIGQNWEDSNKIRYMDWAKSYRPAKRGVTQKNASRGRPTSASS